MASKDIRGAIEYHKAKFVDLRFTDMRGKEQHITIPSSSCDDTMMEYGKIIDGSSFNGWQPIHESDLLLIPDTSSIMLDPFYQEKTIFIRCNVVDPKTGKGYELDPRFIDLTKKWRTLRLSLTGNPVHPNLRFFELV